MRPLTTLVRTRRVYLTAVVCLMALPSCKKGAPKVSIPAEPDKAVLQGIAALKANKPVEAYGLLPKSMRDDIQGLVTQATSSVDKDIFELAVKILEKVRSAADKHADKLSAIGIPNIKESAKAIGEVLGLLKKAGLLDYSSFKKFNVAQFLNEHGSRLMKHFRMLAEKNNAAKYERFKKMLEGVQVKVVKKDGNEAKLEITVDGKSRKIRLVKIDGAWVPAELGRGWKDKIAEAKKQLDKGAERMKKGKERMKQMLEMVLAMVTDFEKSGDLSKVKGMMRAFR